MPTTREGAAVSLLALFFGVAALSALVAAISAGAERRFLASAILVVLSTLLFTTALELLRLQLGGERAS